MAFADIQRLVARIDLEGNLGKGIAGLKRQLKGFDSDLGRVAGGAGKVSKGLAKAGTVVAGVAATGLAAAAKAAIDWEDAFAGVVKTVDEADLKSAGLTFDDLAQSIRQMSLEMPNSAIELAGIAEAAGALGIKASDIEAFTKQVAILAATTDVSAEDAATALGQLQNVIGLTGDEFDNFAAALVDLGNKGASTESQILEIAKRSGLTAKNAGLAKDQIVAFASAAANLGLDPEAAGTNLSKFYDRALSAFEKGVKPLQEIMGLTPKQLKKSFKDDPAKAISSLLHELGKLKGAEQTDAIVSLFGNNTIIKNLVRGLAESLDTNLTPALETSAKAWFEATAAQEEFEKRNATVKSALSRLKNGIIDAAVSVGEGFVPALGRAADKLAEFLKDPVNRGELQKLGEDIGKAIDGIDWNEVLDGAKALIDVMKLAFDWAKRLFDLFRQLPTEVQGAAAGFVALNKLSGNLIAGGVGDIIKGLGGALAKVGGSRLGGVGKLFAQPVFVTNFPPGFGGGGPGGVAGGKGGRFGALGTAAAVGFATVAIGTAFEKWAEVNQQSTDQAAAIKQGLDSSIAGKSLSELKVALAGVNQGISDITSNPLLTLVQGEALTALREMKGSLEKQITAVGGRASQDNDPDSRQEETNKRLESLRSQSEMNKDDTVEKISKTTEAALGVKREAVRGLNIVNSTTRSGSAAIVSTIRSSRPIINTYVNVSATAVTRTTTVVERYGSTGGSRHAPGTGPLES